MKKLAILILFLLSFLSQIIKGDNNNNHFQNINIKDGLSHSVVTSLIEDDKGFIWIGTQDGINRYDGYSMKSYYAGTGDRNPKYSWTKTLFTDSYGQIWIIFNEVGIERFDPEKEIFYDYKNNPNNTHSISTNETFTSTNFSCIYEDSDSSVWIATASGLNRYNRDKDNFDVFIYNPDETAGLCSNEVTFMVEDDHKILWIGTTNGLNYYDLKEHKMHKFVGNQKTNDIMHGKVITSILPLKDGSVIVGTFFYGINYIQNPLNKNKLTVSYYLTEPLNKNYEATIYKLLLTNDNRVLVGAQSGMYVLEKRDNSISCNVIKATKGKIVSQIFEDSLHDIWVVSNNTLEILKFNEHLTDFISFTKDKKNPNHITNQKIYFITQTSNEILWIGTEKDGVYKYDLYSKKFNIIDNNPARKINIGNNEVYSVFEDKNNFLWIGTKNGLNKINTKTGEKRIYQKKEEQITGIDFNYSNNPSGNLVGVIKATNDHQLWLGYFDYKVSLLNLSTDIFTIFQHNKKNPNSYLSWSQRTICVTRNDEVFFGATSNGLCKLNKDRTSFTYYPVNSGKFDGTNDSWINIITEDKDDILWIGTMTGGLNKYNRETGSFEYFTHDNNNLNSLPSNKVKCIMEPKVHGKNILWIGTDNGFSKFDKTNYSFTNYKTNEGHSGNVIHGILEDDNGYLWMSSNKGLIKFNPETETSHVYFQEDGVQSNEFNEGAYFKNSNGLLYFGGLNGVTYFNPQNINTNPFTPKIQITNFKIFNQSIHPGDTVDGRVILKKSITYTNEITLTHNDKVVSFSFVALHFAAPTKIKYKYQLEGLESTVNEVNYKQRFINYTNIPSGKYKLKIWATNNDGVWSNNPKVLKINVLLPFWETWWFILSLIVFIIIIIIIIINYRTKILKEQKDLLNIQVEEQTKELKNTNIILEIKQTEILQINDKIAKQRDNLKTQNILLENQKEEIKEIGEKLHKADEMKLRFFTNISHEIRTPLTLIMGPTKKLLSSPIINNNNELKDYLNTIYKNEKRLLNLINQLLDIRKIETGAFKLSVQKTNLVLFLKEIIELFQPLAVEKQIQLDFNYDNEKLKLYFDPDKIEKIIDNLLSNAFKFVPKNGKISLIINSKTNIKEKQFVKITVADTGKGISKKHLPKIFNRFYQISQGQTGSGIGLSICMDHVNIHKGAINVVSTIDVGTSFHVFIPRHKGIYSKEEISNDSEKQITLNYSKTIVDSPEYKATTLQKAPKNSKKSQTILLVEDNIDMSKFIASILSKNFNVLTAFNGQEGLELAKKYIPDMIISDIMMPLMDGIELSNLLKSNNLTSHLPIVLLTAKSEDNNRLEGLKLGIDDYITKPFNPDILEQKINNILETRRALARKFARDKDIIPSNINISEIDQGFIEKIAKYIENNIDDPDLNGEKLSLEMEMSKGTLYKKLKALTGMTVNIYIRTIRLKIAAKLLKSGIYNISEVAYSTGFNNPKYFSTCFRELFSMSPKEYMIKSKKEA